MFIPSGNEHYFLLLVGTKRANVCASQKAEIRDKPKTQKHKEEEEEEEKEKKKPTKRLPLHVYCSGNHTATEDGHIFTFCTFSGKVASKEVNTVLKVHRSKDAY